MGQKVHPIGIRLGITKEWSSKWYANSQTYPDFVEQDHKVRQFLAKRLKDASVSRVHIERPAKKANITIHTARPGIVIGKKGEDIEKLRTDIAALLKMQLHDVRINIAEIRKPEVDAKLVAEGIAQQLERRVQFRRAMRRAVTNTMRVGAEGIKVKVSGRLNGAEIARSEWYREGRVPLHTLRADIDYGLAEARTTYGVIGVKVWICRGEVFDSTETSEAAEAPKSAKPAASGQPAAASQPAASGQAAAAGQTAAEPAPQE
jgi:small subunit ribosomal protein S3